jgi:hypothetical protein
MKVTVGLYVGTDIMSIKFNRYNEPYRQRLRALLEPDGVRWARADGCWEVPFKFSIIDKLANEFGAELDQTPGLQAFLNRENMGSQLDRMFRLVETLQCTVEELRDEIALLRARQGGNGKSC